MAEREKNLLNLILEINKESENIGLYVSIKKTKIMTTAASGEAKFRINDESSGFHLPWIKNRLSWRIHRRNQTQDRTAMVGIRSGRTQILL